MSILFALHIQKLNFIGKRQIEPDQVGEGKVFCSEIHIRIFFFPLFLYLLYSFNDCLLCKTITDRIIKLFFETQRSKIVTVIDHHEQMKKFSDHSWQTERILTIRYTIF